MEKILIVLEVPAIGESFEVRIPPSLLLCELATVLGKSVEDLTEGRYRSSGEELLCTRRLDGILSGSLSARDYGIENGETLLLI